jgi:hypothetical protein
VVVAVAAVVAVGHGPKLLPALKIARAPEKLRLHQAPLTVKQYLMNVLAIALAEMTRRTQTQVVIPRHLLL